MRHSFGRGGLWRPALVAAAAGLLQLVSFAPAGAGRIGPLVQVSSDPFATHGFEHRTEVEPEIFPVGHSVVAAFQVGRASEGGAEAIGVATSTDEGRTWSSETLAGATIATGGSFGRASDPSVTFDARTGSWLIGYLAVTVTAKFEVPTRSAIEVARSTAGTISFGEPIAVARAPRGLLFDKPWVTCDGHPDSPYFGRCYAVWSEAGLRDGPFNLLLASTSLDGGVHWSPPERTTGRAHGFGAIPVTRPDGSVIVVYLDSAHAIHPRIAAFVSVDGGASWGPSSTIAVPRRAGRDLPVRDPGLPSVAIDERGAVYVAWSDCRFEPRCAVDDIVLSRSRGSGWASPILAVNGEPSSGTSAVTPGLAVRIRGPKTAIALVYYAVAGTRCERFRPGPCTVTVGYASSRDGGVDWSAPATIGWPMRPTWFPSTRPGFMWGDYVAAAIVGNGTAIAVLPLARRPNEGVLDVAMYAPVRGLPIRRA